MDIDSNDEGIGWGRPRPKFEDLLPDSDDDVSDGEVEESMVMVDRHHDGRIESNVVIDRQQNGGDGDEHRSPRWLPTNNIFAENNNDPGRMDHRVAPLRDFPLGQYTSEQEELNVSYPGLSMKKYYTCWDNDLTSPDTRYTCIFTCPQTGEHFAAGNWVNDKGVTEVDGAYWYNTKKDAMNAAAAKALDCFSLRRCHGTDKEPWQRCVDSPYLSTDQPNLPDLPPDVVLLTPTLSEQEESTNQSKKPVKQALIDWYRSFAKRLENVGIVWDAPANEIARPECYTTWSNLKTKSDKLYTAIFMCPLSGERFASGRLNDEKCYVEEGYWYYDTSSCTLINKIDANESSCMVQRIHLVWYSTKKDAEMAAAGRCLDCMNYRDALNTVIADTRYCEELPYIIDTPGNWKLVPELSIYGGIQCTQLPLDERLTTQLGVPNLHSLIEDDYDAVYWRNRYKKNRLSGGGDEDLTKTSEHSTTLDDDNDFDCM